MVFGLLVTHLSKKNIKKYAQKLSRKRIDEHRSLANETTAKNTEILDLNK